MCDYLFTCLGAANFLYNRTRLFLRDCECTRLKLYMWLVPLIVLSFSSYKICCYNRQAGERSTFDGGGHQILGTSWCTSIASWQILVGLSNRFWVTDRKNLTERNGTYPIRRTVHKRRMPHANVNHSGLLQIKRMLHFARNKFRKPGNFGGEADDDREQIRADKVA